MKKIFKTARELFHQTGASLVMFLAAFGLVKDRVVNPVFGKLWSLVLKTSPDGYLTTGNFVSTLVQSPWVILAGMILLAGLVLISLWQLNACILGAGYAAEGKRPTLKDLLKASVRQFGLCIRKKNWGFPVYVMILLPLFNVYTANDLIGTISLPEYIADYIELRPALSAAVLLLVLGIAYLMLRWFYLLPAFILGTQNFGTARRESMEMTKKGWLANGLRIAVYNALEVIRIGAVPVILIFLPVIFCYAGTEELEFSSRFFNIFGIMIGGDLVSSITGTFVTVSVMCYLTADYRRRREEQGKDASFCLPALPERTGKKRSVIKILALVSLCASVPVSGVYLTVVYAAQKDRSLPAELFESTEIIAHKGYSSKAPENTMPAFELADACSTVDMIELDVRSTKDGVPVVIHNGTITEATGIKKSIGDCTYEELKKYPAVYSMDPEKYKDARIPSLEEVLAAYCNSTPILIEIKGYSDDPALPGKIVDLIHKYDLNGNCRIHSGSYEALRAVKELDPEIPCGLVLVAGIGSLYNMPYADFFSMEHSLITSGLVNSIHRHGKEIYAWTVNYSENADRLKFSGVDALITDYPENIGYYVSDKNALLKDAWEEELENALNDLFDGDAEEPQKTVEESDV